MVATHGARKNRRCDPARLRRGQIGLVAAVFEPRLLEPPGNAAAEGDRHPHPRDQPRQDSYRELQETAAMGYVEYEQSAAGPQYRRHGHERSFQIDMMQDAGGDDTLERVAVLPKVLEHVGTDVLDRGVRRRS